MSNVHVARRAATLLANSGLAEIKYLTAVFEPYSGADHPDLVFVPRSGPNADALFLTELCLDRPGHLPLPSTPALVEHRRFLQCDIETYLFFAVATDSSVDEATQATLAVDEIKVLDLVDSGETLADQIMRWAEKAVVPPWADPHFESGA